MKTARPGHVSMLIALVIVSLSSATPIARATHTLAAVQHLNPATDPQACARCVASQRVAINGEKDYQPLAAAQLAADSWANYTAARELAAIEKEKAAADAYHAAADQYRIAKLEHATVTHERELAAKELETRTRAAGDAKAKLDLHVAASDELCKDIMLPTSPTGMVPHPMPGVGGGSGGAPESPSGACDFYHGFTFRDVKMVENNMGGMGPTDVGNGRPIMKLNEVGHAPDGTPLALMIKAVDEYKPANVSWNNIRPGGNLAQISVAVDTDTKFNFTLVRQYTEEPVTLPTFTFSVLDIDHATNMSKRETIKAYGYSSHTVFDETGVEVGYEKDGRRFFRSTVTGEGEDNPLDPMELSEWQKRRAVNLRATQRAQLPQHAHSARSVRRAPLSSRHRVCHRSSSTSRTRRASRSRSGWARPLITAAPPAATSSLVGPPH